MVSLHHIHPRFSTAASSDYNRRRKSFHDVLLSMRFGLTRDLSLKRSLAIYYSLSRQQRHLKSPITMATKSEKTSTEEKDKKEEVSLPPPPPPEKPEPGDCCGSGCVRCVWDVYYEELQEYNKLSTSVPGQTKSNWMLNFCVQMYSSSSLRSRRWCYVWTLLDHYRYYLSTKFTNDLSSFFNK